MLTKTILIGIFASTVFSRNVPSFNDLDEDDQMLFRAAYDTPTYGAYETPSYEKPSYNSIEYHEVPIDKLDLLKDGMWALKAKLKEMKAFNKALAANLLLTKLKVKELLAHHMQPLKKHQHIEVDKKPVYTYQPQPSYPQYEQPQYAAPQPQYTPPQPQYTPPQPQYTSPQSQYTPPQSQYTPPEHKAPQAQHYATEYDHDPYYGQ